MGYKLILTDEQGVVVLTVDLADYNLTKPMARASLVEEIQEAIDRDAVEKNLTR